MAKKTLLQLTQEILSVMESDEVNSITDTSESEAVARVVKTTFEELVSNRNWPSHKKLLKINAYADSETPTHFSVQDEMKELLLLNYNKTKLGDARLRFENVKWKEPDDFLRLCNLRDSTKTNVKNVTDPSGVNLLILNDKQPQYYTTFNDEDIVMDSWDLAIDDTLHEDKIQAYGYIIPSSTLSDDWIPDLPDEAFSLLLQEATSTARAQIDQVNDAKAEQKASRQSRWLSRKAWTVNGGIKYPSYGRRGVKGSRDTTFKRDK